MALLWFQFLIGRLQAEKMNPTIRNILLFQFLIGRLQAVIAVVMAGFNFVVSIPYRQATGNPPEPPFMLVLASFNSL